MIKRTNRLSIDWEAVGLWLFGFILITTLIALVAYSLADTYYGTAVTAQMTVVDKEKVLVDSENGTYVYRADLLEDGHVHEGVSFAHSHWRQLAIGRTYRMTCIEGYYTKRLTSCSP